jgi:hypothetical protein
MMANYISFSFEVVSSEMPAKKLEYFPHGNYNDKVET